MSADASLTTSGQAPPAGDGLPTLEAHVHVRPGYLRATNVEQHGEYAQHYIPTGRALDIERVSYSLDELLDLQKLSGADA